MYGKPLDTILRGVVRQHSLNRGLENSRAVTCWQQVVGPQLSQISRAERLQDGVLQVRVRSGAWAQELSLVQRELVERYRKLLGKSVVRRFRFTVGTLDSGDAAGNPVGTPRHVEDSQPPRELTKEEFQELVQWRCARESELQQIDDPDLAKRLRAWLKVMLQRRKRALQRGGTRCPRCGVVGPYGHDICVNCRLELDSSTRNDVRELLLEMPWLGPDDIAQLVYGAKPETVADIRRRMAAELRREVRQPVAEFLAGLNDSGSSRVELKRLLATTVMLEKAVRPCEVSRNAVFCVLGPQAAEVWGRLSGGENKPT